MKLAPGDSGDFKTDFRISTPAGALRKAIQLVLTFKARDHRKTNAGRRAAITKVRTEKIQKKTDFDVLLVYVLN